MKRSPHAGLEDRFHTLHGPALGFCAILFGGFALLALHAGQMAVAWGMGAGTAASLLALLFPVRTVRVAEDRVVLRGTLRQHQLPYSSIVNVKLVRRPTAKGFSADVVVVEREDEPAMELPQVRGGAAALFGALQKAWQHYREVRGSQVSAATHRPSA